MRYSCRSAVTSAAPRGGWHVTTRARTRGATFRTTAYGDSGFTRTAGPNDAADERERDPVAASMRRSAPVFTRPFNSPLSRPAQCGDRFERALRHD